MHFIEMLENLVLRKRLLSSLEVNDLLRLRRVCKSSKNATEDFIRIEKVTTRRRLKTEFHCESNDDDDDAPNQKLNVWEANSNGIPIHNSRIVYFSYLDIIRSDTSILYCLPAASAHTKVTHLTLHTLGIPLYSKNVLTFLESFPNVTHLRLQDIMSWWDWSREANFVPAEHKVKIPLNFTNLKSLCIIKSNVRVDPAEHQDMFDYIEKLVETCLPNLQELSLPFREFFYVNRTAGTRLACMCLYRGAPNLKILNADGCSISDLLRPDYRQPEMGSLEAMLTCVKERVISIRNPMRITFLFWHPNLEEVEFTRMSRWSMPDLDFISRTNWSNLKKITVTANLEYPHRRRVCGEMLVRLWSFLFSSGRREHVIQLELSLKDFADEFDRYPMTTEMMMCFPNLKVLKIQYWYREHATLAYLWKGLPLRLEELHFHHCTGLDNVAFVVGDSERPAFLDLKCLKVLEFGGMEQMLLTDALFTQVICHLPLRKLGLSSDGEVQSVTLNGIKSLATGTFATTIERFSLKHLQLAGVKDEEKKIVETLFRSSRMI